MPVDNLKDIKEKPISEISNGKRCLMPISLLYNMSLCNLIQAIETMK